MSKTERRYYSEEEVHAFVDQMQSRRQRLEEEAFRSGITTLQKPANIVTFREMDGGWDAEVGALRAFLESPEVAPFENLEQFDEARGQPQYRTDANYRAWVMARLQKFEAATGGSFENLAGGAERVQLGIGDVAQDEVTRAAQAERESGVSQLPGGVLRVRINGR